MKTVQSNTKRLLVILFMGKPDLHRDHEQCPSSKGKTWYKLVFVVCHKPDPRGYSTKFYMGGVGGGAPYALMSDLLPF